MTPVHNDNETVINVAFDNPERMSAALQRYLDDVGHVAPDERGIAGLMIHELHALSAQSGDNQNTVPVVLE